MKAILLFLSAVLLGGCNTAHQIRVSALNSPAALAGGTYVFQAGSGTIQVNDLQFREVAEYLRPALAAQGYYEVDDPASADVMLFVSYGVGEPEPREYTYSYPVYAETGGGSRTVTSTTTGADGKATTTTTVVENPSHRQRVGSEYSTHTVFEYRKFLTLSARDNSQPQEARTAEEVWHLSVVTHDSGADLREVLPAMVAAAAPYLGGNTGKAILVRVPRD